MGCLSGKPQDETKYDYLFKIVLTGELGVGKSSIALQYLEKTFTGEDVAGIGSEFRNKMIMAASKKVKIQLWDTAGQEKFRAITVSYFRGASAVVVVIDVTNPDGLENFQKWIQDAKTMVNKQNVKFLVLANKTDLKNERKLTSQQIKDAYKHLQKETDFLYAETSAKNGNGITEAFEELAETLVNEALGRDNRLDA